MAPAHRIEKRRSACITLPNKQEVLHGIEEVIKTKFHETEVRGASATTRKLRYGVIFKIFESERGGNLKLILRGPETEYYRLLLKNLVKIGRSRSD